MRGDAQHGVIDKITWGQGVCFATFESSSVLVVIPTENRLLNEVKLDGTTVQLFAPVTATLKRFHVHACVSHSCGHGGRPLRELLNPTLDLVSQRSHDKIVTDIR